MSLSRKWHSMDLFGSKESINKQEKEKEFDGSGSVHLRGTKDDHHHSHHGAMGFFRSRLSSLSGGKDDHHSSTAVRRERDKDADPPDAGLVQRCVIIQRDEKGYGFTVTGDNPVFVASVKPDGAAARAGVQNNDRIVKVNGTLVTSRNHLDVVKLIKSGSYVALTLVGKPQTSAPVSTPPIANSTVVNTPGTRESMTAPNLVTAPQPVNAEKDKELRLQKIHMTKAMYETAVEEYQKLERQFTRSPSEKLQHQLLEKRKTVEALGSRLQHLNIDGSSNPTTPPSLISKHRYSDSEHGNLEQFAGQSWYSHRRTPSTPSTATTATSSSSSPSPSSYSQQPHHLPPMSIKHAKQKSVPALVGRCSSGDHFSPETTKGSTGGSAVVARSKSDAAVRSKAKTSSIFYVGNNSNQTAPGLGSNQPAHVSEAKKRYFRLKRWRSFTPGMSLGSHHHHHPLQQQQQQQSDHQNESSPLLASSLPSAPSDLSSMSDSPHTSPSISPTPNDSTSMTSLLAHRHNGQDTEDSNLNSMTLQEIIHDEDEDMGCDDIQFLEVGPGVVGRSMSPPSHFVANVFGPEVNDPGPFVNIKLLESRPAHMAVLLQYLISNSDPSAVLFYIISNGYSRSSGSVKDLRKWAYEIYSVFVAQGCPLSIGIDDKENLINQMDSILTTAPSRTDSESALRSMFEPAHACIHSVISESLADFRNKKELGFGNFYGFDKLQEGMDKTSMGKVAEEILIKYLESVAVGSDEINSCVNDKDMATGWALATFLRLNGVGGNSKAHSTGWDKVPSFMMKDKKIKFPVSRSGKAKSVKGHQFTNQHFYVTTICNRCGLLIWGVGYQGFQCQSCEMTVHKQCVDEISEVCGGKKKRVPRFPVPRKPSNISAASYMSFASNQSMGSNATDTSSLSSNNQDGTGSGGGPLVQPIPKDDDGDLAGIPTGHSVKSIAMRYEGHSPLEASAPSIMSTSTTSSDGLGGGGGLDIPGHPGTPGSLGNGVRRGSSDLNRSGSLNKKEEKGDRRARRAKSDVEMDSETFKAINQSGSSSTSSMSNRSGESPSTSIDNVHEQEELDRDVEPELPTLKKVLGEDVLRKLKPKEKKRQEVINELMYTERAHLRNLKVLDKIFNQPMRNDIEFMSELAKALFPNLDEMVKLHESITKDFKDQRDINPVIGNVGDILLKRFDGENGEVFRKACAEYCRNQAHTLEALKRQTRKESKLAQFLTDAESKPVCRRLHLRDLVPSQMQRLTKYPLLIENLMKYTTSSSEEQKRLQRAHERCRHILLYVNQAVRECENYHKLKEIQKKLDKKSLENSLDPAMEDIKNLKLVEKKLIFDGPLTWKLKQNRTIDLHVLLLEDLLVLLQKQDDKYVLKYQNSNNTGPSMRDASGKEEYKYTHSPVLKLQNLLVRDVATEKKSFFVVNLSAMRAQMYELIASSKELREKWGKLIQDRAEDLKKMDAEKSGSRPLSALPSRQVDNRMEADSSKLTRHTSLSEAGHKSAKKADVDQLDGYPSLGPDHHHHHDDDTNDDDDDDQGLVQPNEVCVSNAITTQATAVRTPLELLRHNSEVIATALEERNRLLAQLLEVEPSPQQPPPSLLLPPPPLPTQPQPSSSSTPTTAAAATTPSSSSMSLLPSTKHHPPTSPPPPTSTSSPSPLHPPASNQTPSVQLDPTPSSGTNPSPSTTATVVSLDGIQVDVKVDGDEDLSVGDGGQMADGTVCEDGRDEEAVNSHDDNNNLEGTLLLRAVSRVKEFTTLVMQAQNEWATAMAAHWQEQQLQQQQLQQQQQQQQQQQHPQFTQRQRRASADAGGSTPPISPNRRMSALAQDLSSDIHSSSQMGDSASTPSTATPSRPVLSPSSSSTTPSSPPPSSSLSSSAALLSKPPLPPLSSLASQTTTTTTAKTEKGKVSMPLDQLKEMMTEMNTIMTKLMSTVNNGKEEKRRLHQELKEARAKLDVLKDMQKQMIISGAVPPDRFTDEDDPDYIQQQQQQGVQPAFLSSPKTATQPPLSPSSFSPPASPLSPSPSPSSHQQPQPQLHHSLHTSIVEEETPEDAITTTTAAALSSSPSNQEMHHGIQEAVEMGESVETLDGVPSSETAIVVGNKNPEGGGEGSKDDSVDKDGDKVIEVAMEDDDEDDVRTNVSVADLPLPDMASVPHPSSHGGEGSGLLEGSGLGSEGSRVGLLDNVELEEMSDEDDSETIVGKGEGSPNTSHDSVQIGENTVLDCGKGEGDNEEEEDEFDDAIEI